MPTSGKLQRGPTGRLLRAQDGSLKRCGCCGGEGECSLVIKAHPCFETLDIDCVRLFPIDRWVCADAECGGIPIGESGPVVIQVAGDAGVYCLVTDPDDTKAYAKLTTEEKVQVIHGPVNCETGCDAEVCGTPPSDVCRCVCLNTGVTDEDGDPLHNSDPDVTPCCIGKVDADGKVCWDARLSGYDEITITRTGHNGGTNPCPSPIFNDCDANASCVVFHADIESADSSAEACDHICGSIVKGVRTRTTVSKLCGDVDHCTPYSYYGCTCPNTAAGTWSEYVPTSFGIPLGLADTLEVVEVYDTHYDAPCQSRYVITDETTNTCDRSTTTHTEEIWDAHLGDGGICLCELYQKFVQYRQIDYDRPQSGDPECLQCLEQIGY